jgi:protein tyrosine/serine phosphatase
LLAGPYPAGNDEQSTRDILASLLAAGLRSVINLTEEDEVNGDGEVPHIPAYEDALEEMGEQLGSVIEIERFAIEKGTAPSSDAMEMILDAIDNEIDGRDSPTLLHCTSGNGRAWLVAGCYLARHGIAVGDDAVARLTELRANDPALAVAKCPETIVQERFVSRWRQDQ